MEKVTENTSVPKEEGRLHTVGLLFLEEKNQKTKKLSISRCKSAYFVKISCSLVTFYFKIRKLNLLDFLLQENISNGNFYFPDYFNVYRCR